MRAAPAWLFAQFGAKQRFETPKRVDVAALVFDLEELYRILRSVLQILLDFLFVLGIERTDPVDSRPIVYLLHGILRFFDGKTGSFHLLLQRRVR